MSRRKFDPLAAELAALEEGRRRRPGLRRQLVFRADAEVAAAAETRARHEGQSMSDVLRDLLSRYAAGE